MSTTVTSSPLASRFSATSSPMKPPPTTTARRHWFCSAQSRAAMASSGVRIVKTPGRPVPGTSGTKGSAPTARISRS